MARLRPQGNLSAGTGSADYSGMTPLEEALRRARSLTPREEALGSMVRGGLAAAAGVVVAFTDDLGPSLLVLLAVLAEAPLLKVLRARWTEPLEGRRPLAVEEPWFDPGTTPVQMAAGLLGFGLMLAAWFWGPWWLLAGGVAMSYAERNVKWAAVGVAVLAASQWGGLDAKRVTLLFLGLGLLLDGVRRWCWPVTLAMAERPAGEVEADLLRLLAEVKGAEARWLVRTSGLASAETVETALERLGARGLIARGERDGYAVMGVTAEGMRSVYATPPPVPSAVRAA